MTDQHENDRRVVVGVDGSDGSKTALRWAMAQARLTGATVEAVGTWQNPAVYGSAYGWVASSYDSPDMAAITGKILDQTIAEVAEGLDRPVEVLARVVQGDPAQVLTEAAAGAQMLVVGTRGHGTFAGILLGSVSQHCVQHAPCPVVVVPQ